ncbi:MAG: two-component regulator propeller domain-containing protein [Bacteroidota bacterium]
MKTLILPFAYLFFFAYTVAQPSLLRQRYIFQERLPTSIVFDLIQDKQGFMWFATEEGLVRYDGTVLKNYRNQPGDTTTLKGNVITTLALASEDQLWVGTLFSGLHLLDLKKEQFQRFHKRPNCNNCISHSNIKAIFDTDHRTYVGTAGTGLDYLDHHQNWFKYVDSTINVIEILQASSGAIWLGTNKGLFVSTANQVNHPFNTPIELENSFGQIKSLAEDSNGNIWLGTTANGLFRYDPVHKSAKRIPLEGIGLTAAGWQHIWDILLEPNGEIWIATDAGAALIVPTQETWKAHIYKKSPMSRATALYKSQDGVLWIGSNNGVHVLTPRLKKFRVDTLPAPIKGVFLHPKVQEKQLWIGTYEGLYQYDLDQGRFHQDFLSDHPKLKRFDRWFIPALLLDSKNRLWITEIVNFNERFTVYHYDFKTKKLKEISNQFPVLQQTPTQKIIEDEQGNIWLANGLGLLQYESTQDTLYFHKLPLLQGTPKDVQTLYLASNNDLWIGWMGGGLSRYNIKTKDYLHYAPKPAEANALVHESVRYIAPYDEQHLLLGTDGGLSIFRKTAGTFQNYTINDGLLEPRIYNHRRDKNGRNWFTTDHYLYSFDQLDNIRAYNEEDGVDLKTFIGQCNFQDEQGTLYFGGSKGILRFHPDSLHQHKFPPVVAFTRFQLFNQTIEAADSAQILNDAIHRTQAIKLRHDQNVISFDFSALSYFDPDAHQYAYYLENFNADWQYIGAQKSVTFTNLDAGNYQLKVKAANADGIWSATPTTVSLIILPPWYRTWWAYLLWIALSSGFIYTFYRFQLNRRLALAEAKRLQELDAVKTTLYTNITHEFRTPITVILGLADEIQTRSKGQINAIKRNGKQLLQLVNQILALSKLESGKEKLSLQQGDVVTFIKYVVESFQSFATAQQIDLEVSSELDELIMDYDVEKLQLILSNLIANAIKFTPVGGRINIALSANKKYCNIHISDTGEGIAAEQLPYIFDRYYQADTTLESTGSGIGLTLVKAYVQMLEGRVSVESEQGKGTIFRLQFPIRQQAGVKAQNAMPDVILPIEDSTIAASPTGLIERPQLLLIEDNKDVLQYLSLFLKNRYELRYAYDGQEGVQKAIAKVPDLIISDVMMPRKNGYELCEQLKKDERTSHIPIILLTAKADFNARLEGLELGADVYLSKPFQKQELLVQINRLLEQRKALQTHYSQLAMLPTDRYQVKKGEASFLYRVQSTLEANLDNEHFDVQALSKVLHLSRMHIHRKLKALTGQSTTQYMLALRLERAKDLLKTSDLSISEIAYRVGFKSQSHFSQAFAREVGRSPSSWRKEGQ